MIVALNMADVARSRGLQIDTAVLSRELGMPVVETIAVHHNGHTELLSALAQNLAQGAACIGAKHPADARRPAARGAPRAGPGRPGRHAL